MGFTDNPLEDDAGMRDDAESTPLLALQKEVEKLQVQTLILDMAVGVPEPEASSKDRCELWVIGQINSKLAKFGQKQGCVIAAVVLLINWSFIISFTTYKVNDCTPVSTLIDADFSPAVFQAFYKDKHVAHTSYQRSAVDPNLQPLYNATGCWECASAFCSGTCLNCMDDEEELFDYATACGDDPECHSLLWGDAAAAADDWWENAMKSGNKQAKDFLSCEQKATNSGDWAVCKPCQETTWNDCHLNGFACADYYAPDGKPYVLPGEKEDGDGRTPLRCDDNVQCIGTTSIIYVVCPDLSTELGVAMGYVFMIEIIATAVILGFFVAFCGGQGAWDTMRETMKAEVMGIGDEL